MSQNLNRKSHIPHVYLLIMYLIRCYYHVNDQKLEKENGEKERQIMDVHPFMYHLSMHDTISL